MNRSKLLSHNHLEQGELLEKDVWIASDVGLKPDNTHSIYYLLFNKITIP